MWSEHRFQDEESQKTALSLSQGGVRQVAFAFLTEAVLTELYASAMVELSKDVEYAKQWADLDEEGRKAMEKQLSNAAQAVMFNTVSKMGPVLAKSLLSMLSQEPKGSS